MVVEEYSTYNPLYEVGGEHKRTVPFTIELREWLIIAHKIGLIFLETLEEVRQLQDHKDNMVCGCFENLAIYSYNEESTQDDDGESAIKPHNTFETGRWLIRAKLNSGYNELVFKYFRADFPNVGNDKYLYIARDTRLAYYWNEATGTYRDIQSNYSATSGHSNTSTTSANSARLGGEYPEHYLNLVRLISTMVAGTDIEIDNVTDPTKLIINYTGQGGGMTFSDLVAILQDGDNITIDVDLLNETITINSTVSPTQTYIRRSDYVLLDRKSYIGIAVSGSLETDAVWTIWVTVTNTAGEVVSNTENLLKKWTERNLL